MIEPLGVGVMKRGEPLGRATEALREALARAENEALVEGVIPSLIVPPPQLGVLLPLTVGWLAEKETPPLLVGSPPLPEGDTVALPAAVPDNPVETLPMRRVGETKAL